VTWMQMAGAALVLGGVALITAGSGSGEELR
jgi:drug/metabolite transporter (DMT)-like permease